MSAFRARIFVPLSALVVALSAASSPVLAFSQIGTSDGSTPPKEGIVAVPLPPLPSQGAPAGVSEQVPAKHPAAASEPLAPAAAEPPKSEPVTPAAPKPAESGKGPDAPAAVEGAEGTGGGEAPGVPAEIFYGEEKLPEPVRDLRRRLIEIAKTGEVEKLRPYIEPGEDGTVLSLAGQDGDPIEFLKTSSGDGEGVEILAILLETLEAGYVRNDAGTDNESYVWPYFTGVPIEKLTKPQKVELFELVTAGDYQEMLGFGAYNFYRLGISPAGKLQFFVAGD